MQHGSRAATPVRTTTAATTGARVVRPARSHRVHAVASSRRHDYNPPGGRKSSFLGRNEYGLGETFLGPQPKVVPCGETPSVGPKVARWGGNPYTSNADPSLRSRNTSRHYAAANTCLPARPRPRIPSRSRRHARCGTSTAIASNSSERGGRGRTLDPLQGTEIDAFTDGKGGPVAVIWSGAV